MTKLKSLRTIISWNRPTLGEACIVILDPHPSIKDYGAGMFRYTNSTKINSEEGPKTWQLERSHMSSEVYFAENEAWELHEEAEAAEGRCCHLRTAVSCLPIVLRPAICRDEELHICAQKASSS